MELFDKNIIVEHIASEPLCWSPEDEDEQKAIKKMDDNNFDLLPIIQNGKINECLTKDKIRRDIGINELLSNSMSLNLKQIQEDFDLFQNTSDYILIRNGVSCNFCQSLISPNAKICPKCGEPQEK